jgi:hypothetical protein
LAVRPDQTAAKPPELSPGERTRLAGILSRLASPFDSERATAALLASAFVAKHNLTWSHLATLPQPLPNTAAVVPGPHPSLQHDGAAHLRCYRQVHPASQGQALDLLT